MTAFQAPKGTADLLPPDTDRWQALLAAFAGAARRGGFGLALSPTFEDAAVFRRGVGESSDVVSKEMYEFEDKQGRHLALRPEGTASVVRAFVQHRPAVPWKVWYATPLFRYESPQAGRYRQHHQLGAELLGTEDPDADVEVIDLLVGVLTTIGLTRLELRVNSIGDGDCMPAYRESLVSYLAGREGDLCPEHAPRWHLNPLRVLDCKTPECAAVRAGAPRLSDALCAPCREHFGRVLAGLDALGIAYVRDDFLVRGLDYYGRTTFEVLSLSLDAAQNALGGGGRYDGLSELLGGPPTPGIGFGSGMERILLACDAEGALPLSPERVDAFAVDLTGGAAARDLAHELRAAGFAVERAFDGRSLKAQLRAADRSGARVALIVGEQEASDGTVTLRVLRGAGGHAQELVARGELVRRLGEVLGR